MRAGKLDKPDLNGSDVKTLLTGKALGFVGLGAMGRWMAINLAASGCRVFGWNRSKREASELPGVTLLGTLPELGEKSEILFTCVTDARALNLILFGDGGIIGSNKHPGKVKTIIDHSTIAPSEAQEISAKLAALKVNFIDAPVTGGDIGAKNKTLTIMCGGDSKEVLVLLPFLYCIGSNVYYCGPSGFGQRTKAVNQLLTAINHLGLAEALALTDKLGLDPTLTMEIVGSGAAGSWAITRNGPKVIAGDFAPGFKAKDQLKDLRFALREAEGKGLRLLGLELLVERFEKLVKEGHGELGNHAVAKLYRDN